MRINLSRITVPWANIKKWVWGSGRQFHTNHCILPTRASSWCLCLQECRKGLLRTWSHKINLLDILSTSPHYFCKKWIGATNENSNFDLRVYIIIIEQRKCLILSPWKVMWETGSYFNHQRIKVMNIKFYCNNTFYSLHHRQKFWLSPSVIWCQNHCSGPYLCTRIWVCPGNWPVKKAIVNLPITGPE